MIFLKHYGQVRESCAPEYEAMAPRCDIECFDNGFCELLGNHDYFPSGWGGS
jgi:hypothetical protein